MRGLEAVSTWQLHLAHRGGQGQGVKVFAIDGELSARYDIMQWVS